MPARALPRLTLKKGREASLKRRHPWVFSGALAGPVEGAGAASLEPGSTVDVVSSSGETLARGACSPKSQLAVKIWTFDPDEAIDDAFFRRRLAAAVARRPGVLEDPRGAARLVHGESDGLPGVVIDRFGPAAVVQLTGAGADRHRAAIVRGLEEVLGEAVPSAWERSDVAARRQEGLEPRVGPLWGPEPPREIEIEEDGRRFLVDVRAGHKTGFYLDQRGNRSLMRDLMAAQSRERSAADAGPRALDAFCYTGGFSLALLAGGAASVVQLDASESALTLARRHVELAGYASEERAPQVLGNAFGELRRLRAENRRFDFIVLDPPKFADTKARVARASRGYKDINLLAFQLLAPGGLLATFSCSGRVLPELFQKIVADAALDAGREARILHRLGAGADHPVALAFPEGLYLKGLVCRVD